VIAVVWLSQATAFGQTTSATPPAPRCDYGAPDRPAPTRVTVFPDGDLFRPLLADPKEPRSGFDVRAGRPQDQHDSSGQHAQYTAGVAAGGSVGIWARKTSECQGLQVTLIGGVFSQFDLDAPSVDLMNSDFIVGGQLSARTRHLSSRIRAVHQSSHLGEDTQRAPAIPNPNFGFDVVDGLLSFESERWRAYGGAGYLWFMNDEGSSAVIHAGGEFRARKRIINGLVQPLAGIDVSSLQSRSWGLTTSASGGAEWTSPAGTRRMRLLLVLTTGYVPFGQAAVDQKARTLGVHWQIEF
jgi:uncharacterized protein DUF1207